MSLSAVFSAACALDGQQAASAQLSCTPTEEIKVDETIPAASTALEINLGVADTSKLKAFMIQNTGSADITALTLDAGTADFPLKAGEALSCIGPGIAKKIADEWSNDTTMLVLKVTTGVGPATAKLRVIVAVDA